MGRMKLKKIPKKKKYKLLFLIIILYLFFAYTFYYSFKNDKKIMNEKFINFLLNNGNTHYIKELHLPKVINSTVKYLLKIDITDPTSLFKENILGYEIPEDDLDDIDRLREISYYMEDPNKEDISKPVVYIYNSHQLENYNNDNLSIYGITPNVLMASYLLKEKLNKSGIATIVEDTDLTEFLDLNKWNYANSYKASRMFILDKINTYDTIKYLIDIHRDSAKKEMTSVAINGKNYARILFVVGLEHKNYQKNLDLANNINKMFTEKYPGISRGVYKKEGEGVDGIYNQDITGNSMLIEVGGIDNNIDEVMNTINAINDVLVRYINSHEK